MIPLKRVLAATDFSEAADMLRHDFVVPDALGAANRA
jgi:hypothetical protein